MTRRRGIAFGIAGIFIIAGAGGYLASRSTRSDPATPVFHRASWMPEEPARAFERLVNDLRSKQRWSSEDEDFVLEQLRRPSPGTPSPEFADLIIPPDDASSEVVEAFLKQPHAQEAIRWHFETFAHELAWAIVQDRLVAGRDVPPELRTEVRSGWERMLESADMYTRIEGATALVATGLFRGNPDLEMTIESMRLGDPSADVRAAIDRRIQHYDRTHHGVEPDGPTSECNTCP